MNDHEPPIQFLRTGAGVNLAYWSHGHGAPPLLVLPGFPMSHLEKEWSIPKLRSFYQLLATRRKLLRFDWRGTGLSDRDVNNFDIDSIGADMLELLDKVDVSQIAILAAFTAGPIAIHFALQHPERVSHLIFWHSFANMKAYMSRPRIRSMSSIRDADWQFFVETATLNRLGWTDAETARRTVDLVNASYDQNLNRKLYAENGYWDYDARLTELRPRALILHRCDFHGSNVKDSTDLAARINNSQFKMIDGEFGYFFGENVHHLLRIIDDFLENPPERGRHQGRVSASGKTLTTRETEILALLAAGLHDKEIAKRLDLTPFTIHRHVANIYKKIDAHGRAEATAYAMRVGLTS